MKQIEITVRIKEEEEKAFEKLERLGYKIIRESDIDDIYLSNKIDELNSENIQRVLGKSVLLRTMTIDGKEIKKITYKNKELDENNDVVSEKKINLPCDDIEKAKELFGFLDFTQLVRVKYHVTVYEKDGREFAFQNVENLGILMEYENLNDFEGKTLDDINSAKKQMLEEVKETGLIITDEIDVKKAKELILNTVLNK